MSYAEAVILWKISCYPIEQGAIFYAQARFVIQRKHLSMMLPVLEEAAFALQDGEVSNIVETEEVTLHGCQKEAI